MRVTLAVFAAVCALVAAPQAAPASTPIYLVNGSQSLSDGQIEASLPAFQTAVDRDFAPIWHSGADIRFLVGSQTPPKGAETITLTDSIDCLMCAGFHDEKNGTPYAEVQVDQDWTVTLTHELFEMLADPDTNWPRAVHTVVGWYMVEVSDPVESPIFGYQIGATRISDFVRPSWYSGSKPFDFTRHVRRPRQVLKDGYQLKWNANTQEWTAITSSGRTSKGLTRGLRRV